MITNPDFMITDNAYDALVASMRPITKGKIETALFEHASYVGGLRQLCRIRNINPDA